MMNGYINKLEFSFQGRAFLIILSKKLHKELLFDS